MWLHFVDPMIPSCLANEAAPPKRATPRTATAFQSVPQPSPGSPLPPPSNPTHSRRRLLSPSLAASAAAAALQSAVLHSFARAGVTIPAGANGPF